MSGKVPVQAKITPIPLPSSSRAPAVLLQRKCACGGSAGLTGQCSECQKTNLSLQHRSVSSFLGSATNGTLPSRFGRDFKSKGIQAKLTVSAPDDMYEREADMVADAVMQIPESQAQRKMPNEEKNGEIVRTKRISRQIMALIQRQATKDGNTDETKEAAENQEMTEEELEELEASNVAPIAQRKADSIAAAVNDSGQAALQEAISQPHGGIPLDTATRNFMESRFGHDFSQVRVHTNDSAHNAARTIQARAFTIGQNIWFARGEFSPGASAGRHLLAHELTHTIQQRGLAGSQASRAIQRSICPSHCETPVGAGNLCKASKVTRDNCAERDEINPDNKISHIRVVLGDRKVTLFWNGAPKTADGTPEEIDCTPNASSTPRGWDKVGTKCGVNHTSYRKYNMAWFTEFNSTGMRFGFHNSQPLGSGFRSAGCVRVSCEDAEKINKHSKSGWTSIIVR